MSSRMQDTVGWLLIISSVLIIGAWLSFAVIHDYKAGLLPGATRVFGASCSADGE